MGTNKAEGDSLDGFGEDAALDGGLVVFVCIWWGVLCVEWGIWAVDLAWDVNLEVVVCFAI